MSKSEELIQELESSDFVVIGTPVHNFTVPSALKAWIDHVVRIRRTFNTTRNGYAGVLRDRPVFVAVSSGGRYSGERARQPDFLTPYLRAILGIIGLHDLTFFSVEGSSLGPDVVAEATTKVDRALHEYFSTFEPQSPPGPVQNEETRSPEPMRVQRLPAGSMPPTMITPVMPPNDQSQASETGVG